MTQRALTQQTLHPLVQLHRLRRITHVMHRDHLTGRIATRGRIRRSVKSGGMTVLAAGLHRQFHEPIQGARGRTGPLHVGELPLGNRADGLNLEHLPHHRQRRGNTTPAAQRIQGGDVKVQCRALTHPPHTLHDSLGVRALLQQLKGAKHRIPVGARDRAAIHHAHTLGTQAAQARAGTRGLHRSRELAGEVNRHHVRKAARRQLVVHVSKRARSRAGSAHGLPHDVRQHNGFVHLGGAEALQATVLRTRGANRNGHGHHDKVPASAQPPHQLRMQCRGAIGDHGNAILCVVLVPHIPVLLPVRQRMIQRRNLS